MEKNILTPTQIKVIDLVSGEEKLNDFYLTGGTALAGYYLGHRFSDDLDFFIFNEPDRIFLHAFVEKIKSEISASTVRYERLYDRNQFFFNTGDTELKVEFTKFPFRQLEKSEVINSMRIDSLRDIAANKIMAMLDRFEPKDFVDLYFMLKTRDLSNVVKDSEIKFGKKIGEVFLGSELIKVRRIEAMPKMVIAVSIEELKVFFIGLAKSLAPAIFR